MNHITTTPIQVVSFSDVPHSNRILTEIVKQVNAQDDDEAHSHPSNPSRANLTPSSPPPSFRSRSSSPSSRRLLHDESRNRNDGNHDAGDDDADQTLADAFDDGSDSEADDQPDDRQRLMRANPEPQSLGASGSGGYNGGYDGNNAAAASSSESSLAGGGQQQQQQQQQPQPQQQQQSRGLFRRPTILPSFATSSSGTSRAVASSNDGVFANLAAKPERGEKTEDLPPVCIFPYRECFEPLLITMYSPMKKLRQIQLLHTGKLPFWHQEFRPTRFL